jgi:hypothetical protein
MPNNVPPPPPLPKRPNTAEGSRTENANENCPPPPTREIQAALEIQVKDKQIHQEKIVKYLFFVPFQLSISKI